MMLLVNGRHAWEISSLFEQQGSCGRAAKSHQHLIMLISQPACSEEMNSSCIFRLAATCLLKAYLDKCDPSVLSKDMFSLLHSTHALSLAVD